MSQDPAQQSASSPDASDPGQSAEEDLALMLAVRDGDMRAFEELVLKHQSAVIGTVARMLGNAEDAHDIAQQVFIRVWKSAPRYEPTAKFTTWLFTITRNLVFNETRRRYRQSEVSMDQQEEESHLQIEDVAAARPDDATIQQELEEAVDRAIAALPEKQRMAVVLRRYEDLPYEEIGEILGLTLPAVKSLLFRARTQLKELLARHLEA